MRALLRLATHTLHRSLEVKLAPLVDTTSIEAYRDLLLTYYGYFPPLEDQILRILGQESLLSGYEPRPCRSLLVRDLLALGVSEGRLSGVVSCPDLPRPKTRHQALGCLYVIEGSALGSQVLYRRFEARLRITPSTGGAYFYGEGPGTANRWSRFVAALEAEPASEAACQEAASAACQTFQALGNWIDARLTGGLDG